MDDASGTLKSLYTQFCDSYHKVDDFRAKLLGFLPLASGVTIFSLLNKDENGEISKHLIEIGIFGVAITLGLLLYELKGIQKCTGFIYYGSLIEEKLLNDINSPLTGQFMGLWKKERLWKFITEPVASAFVYTTVLTAWIHIAFMQKIGKEPIHVIIWWIALALFWSAAFAGVYWFWRKCSPPKAALGSESAAIGTIEKELLELNEEIRQYEFACNWEKLEPYLARDLTFSRIDKSVANKSGVREGLKQRKYIQLSNSNVVVKFNEKQADHVEVTLTVDYHFIRLNDGLEAKGKARNVRFFRMDGGKWKLFAWFNEESK